MLILIVKPDVKVNIISHEEDKRRVDENICLVTSASYWQNITKKVTLGKLRMEKHTHTKTQCFFFFKTAF